jgi:hypothetical protein
MSNKWRSKLNSKPVLATAVVVAFLLAACATGNLGGGVTHRWAINLAGHVNGTANRVAELTEYPDGTAAWRIMGAGVAACDQGDHKAEVRRKNSTTGEPIIIVRVVPRMTGCEPVQFVMKVDGTGGWSEVVRDGKWTRLEGGLGLTELR